MEGTTNIMVKKSKTTKAKSDVNPQVARILETAENTRPNVQAFVDWIVAQGGPEMDVEHTQIVISSYKHFQKSDAALAYREEVGQTREQAQAERDRVREEKRAAREAKAAEEKAAKAAAKEKATKVTKGKSAAATSVPKTATKGKAPAKKAVAKKAAPAKKKAAKKAAF